MAEFHFLRPLWLLALLPLVPLLRYWLRRSSGPNPWRERVDAHLFRHLFPEAEGPASRLPVLLLGLGWLLAVLALAGPSWDRLPTAQLRPDTPPLVIALDLSRSMGADDLRPSRLAAARAALQRLLERLPPRPVGLLVYAGDAHAVLPLTEDSGLVAKTVAVLRTGLIERRGSDTAAAIEQAAAMIGEEGGDLLLVTDGAAAGLAVPGGVRVTAWAFATDEGGAVPLADGTLLTHEGRVVRPRLERAPLEALGRLVVHRRDGGELEALLSAVAVPPRPGGAEALGEAEVWVDRGPWLILALLPLAAVAFRKGWLAVVVLAVALPVPEAGAVEWETLWADVWSNGDRRGLEAFRDGDYVTAAERFDDPLWRGAALYRLNDLQGALAAFAESEAPLAHYNRGNVLVHMGRLEEAREAFQQVLRLDPGHPAADFNLAVVERELIDRRRPPSPPPPADPVEGKREAKGEAAPTAYQEDRLEPEGEVPVPPEPEKPPQVEPLGNLGGGVILLKGTEESDTPEGESGGQGLDRGGVDSGESAPGSTRPGEEAGAQQPGDSEGEESRGRAGERGEGEPERAAAAEPGESGASETEGGEGAEEPLDPEERQALEQWLERIPDDPAELLRALFRGDRGTAGAGGGVPW